MSAPGPRRSQSLRAEPVADGVRGCWRHSAISGSGKSRHAHCGQTTSPTSSGAGRAVPSPGDTHRPSQLRLLRCHRSGGRACRWVQLPLQLAPRSADVSGSVFETGLWPRASLRNRTVDLLPTICNPPGSAAAWQSLQAAGKRSRSCPGLRPLRSSRRRHGYCLRRVSARSGAAPPAPALPAQARPVGLRAGQATSAPAVRRRRPPAQPAARRAEDTGEQQEHRVRGPTPGARRAASACPNLPQTGHSGREGSKARERGGVPCRPGP
jgi:hypothetical protein